MRHMKTFSKHEIMVRHRIQNLISVNKVRFFLGVVINGLNSVQMIRDVWPFVIVFFVVFICNTVENNQKVCIDCLKARSNKNKFECNNCGCTKFYLLDYQNSSYVMLSSL